MKRRDFLKILPIAACPATETDYRTWRTHVCETGTHEGDNVTIARNIARAHKCEVLFTFNYHRHYRVYPDGRFEFKDDALV